MGLCTPSLGTTLGTEWRSTSVKYGKPNIDLQVVYAFAHCEAWLEDYAKSASISSHELTERVGNLLLGQTSGKVLGTEHNVSTMRSRSTKGSKTLATVALDDSPRGQVQGVKRRSTGAIKAYWARMTPDERSQEMRRRMRKAAEEDQHG